MKEFSSNKPTGFFHKWYHPSTQHKHLAYLHNQSQGDSFASNTRPTTTINTSSDTVASPHTDYPSDTFCTLSQTTTSVLWERVASLPFPLSWYCDPNPTPPCAILAWNGRAAAGLTSYPHRFLGHVFIWLVSISDQISNPPRSTTRVACASTQPLPPRIVSVPMVSPGGRGGWRRGGDGAVWRKLTPWEVFRENVIGILGEANKEGKGGKYPYCLL